MLIEERYEKDAKTSNFENFVSALYLKSGSMPKLIWMVMAAVILTGNK